MDWAAAACTLRGPLILSSLSCVCCACLQGLEKVKKSLFSKLHDIAREEMFPEGMLVKPEAHKK